MRITTVELQQFHLLSTCAKELSTYFDRFNTNYRWSFTFKDAKHFVTASTKNQGQVFLTFEFAQPEMGGHTEWITFSGWSDKKVFEISNCWLEHYNPAGVLSMCEHFIIELRKSAV